ncbi:membrane protein [Leptospira santarosai]|uniref:membrane protein n=1 Tax=Leptospira santarosai TaxID=28183 RepID=UPI0005193C8F|nr:membrane protein [Leptospira santarosai]
MVFSRSRFTIFALVISTLSFAVHAYRIHGLPQLFPPFTIHTQIKLWICFVGLAVTLFDNKLPEIVRYVIQPILVLGVILCVVFVIQLFFVMLFAWLFFWVVGLPLLTYSPVFALIAFVRSARRIHNSVTKKQISTWLIGGTLAIVLLHSILYKVQWDRAEKFVQEEDLRIEKLAGRDGISSSDARYIEYMRNITPFRWMLNGKYQCERVSLSEKICPFVNSILSVEECVHDNGCGRSLLQLAK